jgi:hypothetical protein
MFLPNYGFEGEFDLSSGASIPLRGSLFKFSGSFFEL